MSANLLLLSPISQNLKILSSNGQISFSNSTSIQIFPTKTIPSIIKTYPKLNLPQNSHPRFPTILQRASLIENDGGEDLSMIIETQEAVSEILQEAGVSKEESFEIALKSPKYVQMLIDGVKDLDELSLWKSWAVENEDIDDLSFRKKVLYMAKQKGDNGILPFLEYVGLNPSSSTHIARYLVSESLPELIHKVKYMNGIIFPNADNDEYIGKNARRMMTQLSIFVDEDVQQTLSFFEKMEARRGGLNMLGSRDASFQYLIESFPRLLLLSFKSHLEPLVQYIEGLGVPKGRIGVIFMLFPPIIFHNIEKDIKPRLHAFEKVGTDGKDIGRMLLKYPWILSTRIQENYKDILSFFELEKVPEMSVDKAIKSWPHILGCSTNKMKTIVELFDELGVKSKKLGQVIASSPQLLLRKPHEVLQVVSFLEELGFDKESIGRILCRCPEICAASIENTLKKKLTFLVDIGISKNHIPRVIRKYPELLVCDVNNTILPRIEYLIKSGLSKREVTSMVCRFSPLLGYSINEVLRPKLEFLVNTMEKPVKDLVDYPRYFSYSLDKKIKPRFWVLKGRNAESSLKDMLGKNDEDFAADYMGIGRMLIPPPSPFER
ncbi:Mitochondrial transcription termination factor family protein [Thalictrum thalictroides]|uniref:Mitochondrial transcription termination factor family protein n=1 Tax=Thalictrum thalictroides TaxID=46969 RepID=A0A7J6VCN3_THATH|nr:Mitochondrial transcription termination factor family protein [Thalictrum thalictroides]